MAPDRLAGELALVVVRMQDGERGVSALVRRLALCLPKRACHVSLPERTTSPRAEDVVARPRVPRSQLVMREHESQLLGDRHRASRSIRLRGLTVAVTVDLVAELELGVIKIEKTDLFRGQRE